MVDMRLIFEVAKCKNCKRENSIDIIPKSGKPYNLEDSGTWVTLIEFDCRGMEITEYEPRVGFVGKGDKGKEFEIDLTDGDWVDFDDQIQESVGVYNFESKIEKRK